MILCIDKKWISMGFLILLTFFISELKADEKENALKGRILEFEMGWKISFYDYDGGRARKTHL